MCAWCAKPQDRYQRRYLVLPLSFKYHVSHLFTIELLERSKNESFQAHVHTILERLLSDPPHVASFWIVSSCPQRCCSISKTGWQSTWWSTSQAILFWVLLFQRTTCQSQTPGRFSVTNDVRKFTMQVLVYQEILNTLQWSESKDV